MRWVISPLPLLLVLVLPPPHAISCRGPEPTRKNRYTSSREEEDVATHMCPCGTTIESRTHIVGECEIRKEERDALEEELRN